MFYRVSLMGKLFGTSGIRGKYPEKVNPELGFKLGAAIAYMFNAKSMCVGGDGRVTTPILKFSVITGAMYVGADVLDTGLVPLPLIPWSIKKIKCNCGVYVTASHNPPTDNGFKVFSGRAMELTSIEEREAEELLRRGVWMPKNWDLVGSYSLRVDLIDEYIEGLSSRLSPSKVKFTPKILIDTANGAASHVTPKVLRNLGAKVFTLNANIDGRFPGRVPEPRPDVLEPLRPIAQSLNADVFFAHDGDGDRLAIVDPARGFIKQDRILALIAYYKLREGKGSIVASIDCGNALKDIVYELGGKLFLTKLGKTHEGLLKYGDVLMAGEPWKLIDPSWGTWVDGIYQAALITKIMMEEGVGIHSLMKQIPNYPQARYSILVDTELRNQIYDDVVNFVSEELPRKLKKRVAEVLTIDGIRINFEDKSWILIRKSGTEPKIRLYAEALKTTELEKMINLVLTHIRRVSKIKRSKVFSVEGALIP